MFPYRDGASGPGSRRFGGAQFCSRTCWPTCWRSCTVSPRAVDPHPSSSRSPALRAPRCRPTHDDPHHPHDLVTWRRHLHEDSDGEFDTTLAHQLAAKLMVEVETLWGERARMRAEVLGQAATALEERLRDLARRGPPNAPGYGCTMCRDAEARSFITYLRGMAATAKPRG